MMKRTIVICLSLMLYVVQMQAQCEAKNEAIQVGEKLTYELKFNWKFIWVNAGEAKTMYRVMFFFRQFFDRLIFIQMPSQR